MKVLHVAVFSPQSTNVWQADGFEELGCEVLRYDYRQRAVDLDGGIYPINPKRDAELITLCRREEPDIILFSKCNRLHIDVVHECNKVGTTVLWYMDNKVNLNGEVRDKFKYCNHIFCSSNAGMEVASTLNNSVYKLQGGFNPKAHYPMELPKIRDVAFIGSLRLERKRYWEAIKFDVIQGVYNEEHSKVVSQTRINLSFTSDGLGISNRIYKLLAAGGFVLTAPWKGMENDFRIGIDLDIFTNAEELQSKIKYYLKHSEEREIIALHGQQTVQNFNHVNYARKILEVCEGGL